MDFLWMGKLSFRLKTGIIDELGWGVKEALSIEFQVFYIYFQYPLNHMIFWNLFCSRNCITQKWPFQMIWNLGRMWQFDTLYDVDILLKRHFLDRLLHCDSKKTQTHFPGLCRIPLLLKDKINKWTFKKVTLNVRQSLQHTKANFIVMVWVTSSKIMVCFELIVWSQLLWGY